MSDTTPKPGIFVERIGTRQYRGANGRGNTIDVGHGPGQWSPGELLKLALLGCNAMSSDTRFAAVLGDDYALGGGIEGVYSEEEDRFESFTVELVPEIGDVDSETIEAMSRRALSAIERQCTIGRTLDHVVPHQTIISKED